MPRRRKESKSDEQVEGKRVLEVYVKYPPFDPVPIQQIKEWPSPFRTWSDTDIPLLEAKVPLMHLRKAFRLERNPVYAIEACMLAGDNLLFPPEASRIAAEHVQ